MKKGPVLTEPFIQRFFYYVLMVAGLLRYLKNIGNATKNATQIRYSMPFICV